MKRLLAALCIVSTLNAGGKCEAGSGSRSGRRAYEASDYARPFQVLQALRPMIRKMATCNCCWRKVISNCWSMTGDQSAEKAVAIDPAEFGLPRMAGQGRTEKRPIMQTCLFGDLTREEDSKEFETAIQLDGKNFRRAGADRIRLQRSGHRWRRRRESVAAESSNWRRWTPPKGIPAGNSPAAEERLRRGGRGICEALESNPKSAVLIYDIGDTP